MTGVTTNNNLGQQLERTSVTTTNNCTNATCLYNFSKAGGQQQQRISGEQQQEFTVKLNLDAIFVTSPAAMLDVFLPPARHFIADQLVELILTTDSSPELLLLSFFCCEACCKQKCSTVVVVTTPELKRNMIYYYHCCSCCSTVKVEISAPP